MKAGGVVDGQLDDATATVKLRVPAKYPPHYEAASEAVATEKHVVTLSPLHRREGEDEEGTAAQNKLSSEEEETDTEVGDGVGSDTGDHDIFAIQPDASYYDILGVEHGALVGRVEDVSVHNHQHASTKSNAGAPDGNEPGANTV